MNDSNMAIRWLRSLRTGRSFPTVLFCGDTDVATSGLVSLSSTSGSEVVVVSLASEEAGADERTASRLVEERINARLGRSDLRYVSLVRVVEHKSPAGISFQRFQASYRPPDVFYRDILEGHGEAVMERDESLTQFRVGGGIVTHVA